MFWSLQHSDPYRALLFDRLHTNHLGLFKDHLWKQIAELVKAEGKPLLGKVDQQSVYTL